MPGLSALWVMKPNLQQSWWHLIWWLSQFYPYLDSVEMVVWPTGLVFNISNKNCKQTVVVINIVTVLISTTKFPVPAIWPVSTTEMLQRPSAEPFVC